MLASALDDCVDSCGLVGVAAAGAKLLNPRAMSLTAVFSEDGNTGAVARAPMIALIVFLMVASRPLAGQFGPMTEDRPILQAVHAMPLMQP